MNQNYRHPGKKNKLEDLYPGLDLILTEAKAFVKRSDVSIEEFRQIAEQISEIRCYLSELHEHASAPGRTFEKKEVIQSYAVRYREAEGMVKEIRNDRERALRAGRAQWVEKP